MGFLKKLFGGGQDKPYIDKDGIYFHFQCDNCGTPVRVRAHKQNDLNREDFGYSWHKTVVDSKCFRRMQTVVTMNQHYDIIDVELTGGKFISEDAYNTILKEIEVQKLLAQKAKEEAQIEEESEEADESQPD